MGGVLLRGWVSSSVRVELDLWVVLVWRWSYTDRQGGNGFKGGVKLMSGTGLGWS